ncbi:hypothetical protein CWE09_00160 [Aliidiomarina minuta]|uniref:Outer membrane protein beta-barrel domain-containing protein n=1 Tax=Aliidiomarina minuta TaxID=880057 RepID=A0A432W560_9GAMM|nr:outer membrane beta-barrel protein [Aliidiomarina minuta]RUO25197.1 hypothetical protein CWE09_00160 [Aliidiomarina minuta]
MRLLYLFAALALALPALPVQATDGWGAFVSGMQSHYSDIPLSEDLNTESKFNEIGAGLVYQRSDNWFVEAALSRGSQLRHRRETGVDEDGEPETENFFGRTYGARIDLGYRFQQNAYFSLKPSFGYMHRGFRNPADEGQQIPSQRARENSLTMGVNAEYLVLEHLAFSISFRALTSGERQQTLSLLYYF